MLPYITWMHTFMCDNAKDTKDTKSGTELELKDTKSDPTSELESDD